MIDRPRRAGAGELAETIPARLFPLLGGLLHDAGLESVSWNKRNRLLRLSFAFTLRRHPGGRKMASTALELLFSKVRAVGVHWAEPIGDDSPRPGRSGEPRLAGIRGSECFAVTVLRRAGPPPRRGAAIRWEAGSRASFAAADCRLALHYHSRRGSADLFVAAESVRATDGRGPLLIQEWAAQSEAWWSNWQAYWDRESASGE